MNSRAVREPGVLAQTFLEAAGSAERLVILASLWMTRRRAHGTCAELVEIRKDRASCRRLPLTTGGLRKYKIAIEINRKLAVNTPSTP